MPETAHADLIASLRDVLGDFFAEHLLGDQAWAVGVLTGTVTNQAG